MKYITLLFSLCLSLCAPLTGAENEILIQKNGQEYQFIITHPQTQVQLLSSKVTVDDNNMPIACYAMDYDAHANLILARLYGNLSGNCAFPLLIQENGRPVENGIENYAMYWTYSCDEPALLLSVTEDNGNTVNNLYDPLSKRLSAELISDATTIYKRRFFEYDSAGNIICIITDNGHSPYANYVEGITSRLVTTFSYITNGAAEGCIEEIEEKRFHIASGNFYSIKRIINTYDAEGKQQEQKIIETPKHLPPPYFPGDAEALFSNYFQDKYDEFMHKVFGKGFLQFTGYYEGITDTGTYNPGCEITSHVRMTLINGILNISSDMQVILQKFSKSHNDITVHFVFRPTEGWTNDVINCALIKLGHVSEPARHLAKLWKKLIEEMGGTTSGGLIMHYAHSIGATDTWAAKDLLTPAQQSMIHVITLGSPSMIPSSSGFASVTNYASKRDAISMLDPIGYIKGWADSDSNVYLVGSFFGLPEHSLSADCYNTLIDNLGSEFVNKHKAVN